MANKRYYWLKLKDDFFSSLRIKKLRRLAGGDTYTIIYLKMQLLSLTNGGCLVFRGIEDDFASEIALDIDEDEDNVRVTIAYLLGCGLLIQDNNDYLLPFVQDSIGSETASTLRSRASRDKAKVLQCNTNATTLQQKCNGDIDKDIEIDKEIDKKAKPSKHIYGEYKKVRLTDDEYHKLKARYPYADELIKILDEYKMQSGKQYASDYVVMYRNNSWVVDVYNKRCKDKPKIDSTYDINDINQRAMMSEEYDI